MNKILLLLIITIFYSCNEKEKSIAKIDKLEDTLTKVKEPQLLDGVGNNDITESEQFNDNEKVDTLFYDFFTKFMWDNEFQLNRVKYPINIKNEIVNESKDWKNVSFYAADDYIPILSTDSISTINNKSNSDTLTLNIINLGVSISKYNFKKIDNKWFLISIKEDNLKSINENEFLKYLTAFTVDTSFQLNHINFPVKYNHFDYENFDELTSEISKYEWSDFLVKNEFNKLFYVSTDNRLNNYRNIYLRGVDNGIWVQYLFKKIDNNWRLTEFSDYST